MKALYLEPFAGVSGNMLLGALLHVGVPFAYLQKELAKLHLGEYELINRTVDKSGIRACYFNVVTKDTSLYEHDHEHGFGNHEHQEHEHHGCDHEYHLEYDHHQGEVSHVHEHSHPMQGKNEVGHAHVHRGLLDIETILDNSDLSPEVTAKAKKVFLALAEAEAKVHGMPIEEVHFHEVGAIDTIIDVVGNLLALQYLGVERIFTMPVNTGFGMVQCAHGLMPVPAPATAELLQGLPHYHGSVAKEMTTPTGAALLKVLAEPVKELPAGFHGSVIGYGAGTREVAIPNVLRVNLGEYVEPAAGVVSGTVEDTAADKAAVVTGVAALNCAAGTGADGSGEAVLTVLECNLDDLNPEILPYVLDRLLETGALDAWLQPIIMKKGRPGYLLSALCEESKKAELAQVLFKETTTLGVRTYQVTRTSLERRWQTVTTPWGQVRVKEGLLYGTVVNQAPEFEDCKQLAQTGHVPLKAVESAALEAVKK